MNEPVRRVPLVEVSDLLAPGAPLPFRVLDAQGRLLLADGQRIADARQLSALMERGACVEWPDVERVRRERGAVGVDPGIEHAVRRETLFDRWEQFVWKLDTLLRVLGRDAGQVVDIDALATQFIGLVDREVDAALFLGMRQDDRRFALYGITHAMHTATVVLLAARTLGWPLAAQHRMVLAALTMNAAIVELQGRTDGKLRIGRIGAARSLERRCDKRFAILTHGCATTQRNRSATWSLASAELAVHKVQGRPA